VTRAARGASLLVAFSLRTSAATASAECAWVLWATPAAIRTEDAEAREAFTTKAECDRGRTWALTQQEAQEKKLRDQSVLPRPPTMYVCLPDTGDPLGPKK